MFPKKGNLFPRSPGATGPSPAYLNAVAKSLKTELGNTHQAIKIVVRWTGANERTVKTWFAAKNAPGLEHLIALLRNSDSVLIAVLLLADRRAVVGQAALVAARAALFESLKLIDSILGE
jgi:hypothetical protein